MLIARNLIPKATWRKDCGVVESLVPREVEADFQAAVVPTPFFVLATVKSLVVDHVGVVVPGVVPCVRM